MSKADFINGEKFILGNYFEFLNLPAKKQNELLTEQMKIISECKSYGICPGFSCGKECAAFYFLDFSLYSFCDEQLGLKDTDFHSFVMVSFLNGKIEDFPEYYSLFYKFMEYVMISKLPEI